MQTNVLQSTDLKSILSAVVRGNQSPRQLSELVTVCHSLAMATLRWKIASAMLQTRLHYSGYADLAYDCIADLFSRSEGGVLTQFKGYFEGIHLERLEQEEILGHLRRLVMSKINHGIFRIYGELDPATGKILRNIKLAIQARENFTITTRLGELQIYPAMVTPELHLPVLDAETLERELSRRVSGRETVPELLTQLSLFLRSQSTHARIVPFLTVVRIIKSLYARDANTKQHAEPEDRFTISDTSSIIKDVCSKVKRELTAKYVGKKVSREIFDAYFVVIEQSVVNQFVGNDDAGSTFYEKLSQIRPEIDRRCYYSDHRSVLEYLGRLTRSKVTKELGRIAQN
jgi:hypothetical protein